MHCSSSAVNVGPTMRTARFASFYFLPSARRREQRESGSDAATRRTVSGIAVLRKPQVRSAASTGTATSDQPKTRATVDAADGHRSLVPEAEPESSGRRARTLSVSAPRCHGQPAEPGLEHRYYIYSDAIGLFIPGGYYGLVQPLRVELGSLQHHGGGLLPICAGASFTRRQVRDLQLRSRRSIYLSPVLAAAEGSIDPHQYGWARASNRQRIHRAAVALREIRTDLSRRIRFRCPTVVGLMSLFRPLQFPSPASGIGLPDPRRTVSESATKEQHKVSRYAAVFAFTAHGLARELHPGNARKRKALQTSQRAHQQPIASEPVRRFGHGHALRATAVRNLSLAESAALCDPGYQPRRSSLHRPKFCPTIGVHLTTPPGRLRQWGDQCTVVFREPFTGSGAERFDEV
jgi:hypothetical protein